MAVKASASIQLVRVNDGQNGSGVVSITPEYYLSTSKTEMIDGSWTTTAPKWTKGKYLWIRTKTVYKNPSRTEYTTPIVDSSWESANDVENNLDQNYYDRTEIDAEFKKHGDKIESTVQKIGIIEATANNSSERVVIAETVIKQLSDSISHLVTDINGSSLMTQTGNGWQFNMGAFQSALDKAKTDITDIKGDVNEVSNLTNKVNQLANDIAKKTAYVNIGTDENGQPCIELGNTDSEFKVRITNTSIDFMQGGLKIAYITNRALYIQMSVVTDSMQIGEKPAYIWKKRSNGNMGLRFIR